MKFNARILEYWNGSKVEWYWAVSPADYEDDIVDGSSNSEEEARNQVYTNALEYRVSLDPMMEEWSFEL